MPGRALVTLITLVAALAAAFVVAPPRLAATGSDGGLADHGHLVRQVHTAVVGYWRSGASDYPPALQQVIDYWFRFHLVKGGIAALLLVALSALTVLLWWTFLRAGALGRGVRAALVPAGTAVAGLALFAVAVVMANLQGALAPFASLLPMLTQGTPDARTGDMLAQARQQLAGSHRTSGHTPPALDVMIDDFARYHAVMVVIALVVAGALLGLGTAFWRGRVRVGPDDRRTRRLLGWAAAGSVLSSLIAAVIVIANVSVAMDPAPALLGLFNGGF